MEEWPFDVIWAQFLMPLNNFSSNIRDHWSQSIITNIIIIQNLEMLWELPKCDTEKQSEQMILKNSTERLAWHGVVTNLHFVKNKISAKHSKVKCKEARCACVSKEERPQETDFKIENRFYLLQWSRYGFRAYYYPFKTRYIFIFL